MSASRPRAAIAAAAPALAGACGSARLAGDLLVADLGPCPTRVAWTA